MKGHIRKRGEDSWELKYDIGPDPLTGRRRIRYCTFRGARRKAEEKLRELLYQVDRGEHVDPTKITVTDLLDRWLKHAGSQVSPKTHERYAQLVEKNIAPIMGEHKLRALRSIHIDEAWSRLLADGRLDGKGGLSPQTVKHCHRVLKQALGQAVRWQLLARNPADYVDPPRVPRKELIVLDPMATARLLKGIKETQFYIPTLIAVLTGLRRGEVLALRWRHVDLDSGRLSVIQSLEQTKAGLRFKETKNRRARHVVMPPLLRSGLRAHKVRQAEALLGLGVRQTDETLVVCRYDGAPMNPEYLSREFPVAVTRMGLPRVNFHNLRHSHATQMLLCGVHPKITQERLGHSSISITMDLYSHLVPGLQGEAAEKVDAVLRRALKNTSQASPGGNSGGN